MKTLKFILFCCVAVAMLAVPLEMIMDCERTLTKGTLYTFNAAPIDPYDIFRGRYVRISIEPGYIEQNGTDFKRGEHLYAILAVKKDGIATLSSLQKDKPAGDYIKVQYRWSSGSRNYVQVPFERYYMNEKLAPEAEQVVRHNARSNSKEKCTIKVRVLGDTAIIENFYIGKVPLPEYVREQLQKK